jgi:hypothetical protein
MDRRRLQPLSLATPTPSRKVIGQKPKRHANDLFGLNILQGRETNVGMYEMADPESLDKNPHILPLTCCSLKNLKSDQ